MAAVELEVSAAITVTSEEVNIINNMIARAFIAFVDGIGESGGSDGDDDVGIFR